MHSPNYRAFMGELGGPYSEDGGEAIASYCGGR